MSEKKELNKEVLENVNGGAPYISTTPPTAESFYHKLGDIVNYSVASIDGSVYNPTNFKVVALGSRFTGSKGPLVGYELLYKFQTVDRAMSVYDGWYDFDFFGPSLIVKKVSGEGLTIVAQI